MKALRKMKVSRARLFEITVVILSVLIRATKANRFVI